MGARAHALTHALRKRLVPGVQSRLQTGGREGLSVSQRTEGREETRTVAAEGLATAPTLGQTPPAAGRGNP